MSMIAMLVQAAVPLPPPQNLPVTKPDVVSPGQAVDRFQSGSLFLDKNLQLSAIILLFGLLALVLLYMIVCHKRSGQFELRIFTITILVFGSLMVAAAGFGSDQLTPLIGFFGTIAGYILGRGDRASDAGDQRQKERPHENP